MSASVTSMQEFARARDPNRPSARDVISDQIKRRLGSHDGQRVAWAISAAHKWYANHTCTVDEAIGVGIRTASTSRDPRPPTSPQAA